VALAASVVALCWPQPAVSLPQPVDDCNKYCQEKTKRLENQVRSLQREVVQLRAEVDRLRESPVNEVAVEKPEGPVSCAVPFEIDELGIKRYRSECVEPSAIAKGIECVSPYIKRPDGVILIRPECVR
jgi:hypothetical protein